MALDLPGFGLSRPSRDHGLLPEEHAAVVERFVRELDLQGVTLLLDDWGGPIGLWVAARAPARFRALAIGNTWAWPVDDDPHFTRFSRLMGGPIGRLTISNLNAFVNVLVPAGHWRRRLTWKEMAHYRGPFRTRASRTPTHVFPRAIVASSGWLADVEGGLSALEHLPALILWGDVDIAFRAKERGRFEALFPRHRTHVMRGVGHFIWDDAPEEILEVFKDWWASTVGIARTMDPAERGANG